jgi:hypothetical protein
MGDEGRPDTFDLLRALTEGQQHNQATMNALGQAVHALVQTQQQQQEQPTQQRPTTHGPKAKEPRFYNGDRSDGKLDDHIRDVQNYLNFYEARGHWASEKEKIEHAAQYLTGRMHRMYSLQSANIHTVPAYIEWLKRTFRDHNEQQRLRDDWHATVQGDKSVMDYASDLVYLASRIVPTKTESDIKDHFRTGLRSNIKVKLAEHPEWDDLGLDDFIARADRQEQIEANRDYIRSASERRSTSRGSAYAINGAPRRGGRKHSPSAKRPRKDTQEWRDWCRERDACYGCGETGHKSRDCPEQEETSRKSTQKRAPSPFVRGRSVSRDSQRPRNRSTSRASSTGRNTSQKNVSFQAGNGRA